MGRFGYLILVTLLIAGGAYVFWPEPAEIELPRLWKGETPTRYRVLSGGLTQEVDEETVRIAGIERPLDVNRHDALWAYVRSVAGQRETRDLSAERPRRSERNRDVPTNKCSKSGASLVSEEGVHSGQHVGRGPGADRRIQNRARPRQPREQREHDRGQQSLIAGHDRVRVRDLGHRCERGADRA